MSDKLRILWLSEASFLSTGYAVYSNEVLKRLFAKDKYEILELAAYCAPGDKRIESKPWSIYPNHPNSQDREEVERFNSNVINQFGAFKFEQACLEFRPNVVIIIRDVWMDSFVLTSPYRKYYNVLWMPTVDGAPQNIEWLDYYSQCDGILTYSDWSLDVLKESANNINLLGTASPAADVCFKPKNKHELKKSLGLEKFKIIGTVMRNQKRKLFPDLFESFRKFLDISKRDDVLLYCHTSYPDNHPWDIPSLINEYGLSSKVLLTYKCGACGYVCPSHFLDCVAVCKNCYKAALSTTSVQNGIDNEDLADVYNLFDLYIQYSNCEGFGVPQVEAAACGVPVMSVDYSAMSDVVRKLKGFPLKVKAKYKEIETGRMFAVPDNEYTTQKLLEVFMLDDEHGFLRKKGLEARQAYLKNYNYDKTAAKYEQYFDSLDINYLNNLWQNPFSFHKIDENIPNDYVSNTDFSKWLILNVLGEPEKLNTYFHTKLLKEINYGFTTSPNGLNYANGDSFMEQHKRREFSRKDAFETIKHLTEFKFFWESKRLEYNEKD